MVLSGFVRSDPSCSGISLLSSVLFCTSLYFSFRCCFHLTSLSLRGEQIVPNPVPYFFPRFVPRLFGDFWGYLWIFVFLTARISRRSHRSDRSEKVPSVSQQTGLSAYLASSSWRHELVRDPFFNVFAPEADASGRKANEWDSSL